jgi:uncharacterized protein (TIGR02996 family)
MSRATREDVRLMRAAVLDSPNDPVARLAYADSLEESGDVAAAESCRRAAEQKQRPTSTVSALLSMCWEIELTFAALNDLPVEGAATS